MSVATACARDAVLMGPTAVDGDPVSVAAVEGSAVRMRPCWSCLVCEVSCDFVVECEEADSLGPVDLPCGCVCPSNEARGVSALIGRIVLVAAVAVRRMAVASAAR